MKLNKFSLLVVGLALILSGAAALTESGYELVSEGDFARSLAAEGADELIERAADPLGPEIEVLRPGDGDEFEAPVDIHITFVPAAGAEIDLDSLKITYGALGINVTDRVTENAEVTPQGILSEGAMLPSGKHKLTVYIGDNLGRTGKRRFTFRITD